VALKKSEKRLLIILGIVLAIFLMDRFIWSADKNKKQSVASAPVAKNTMQTPGNRSAVNNAKVNVPAPGVKRHFPGWKTDPFAYSYAVELARQNQKRRPGNVNRAQPKEQVAQNDNAGSNEEKKENKGPVLNGVFWKEGKAFALIDGVIMEEGEEREGLKVLQIRGSEVICRKGNRTFTIQWRESQ